MGKHSLLQLILNSFYFLILYDLSLSSAAAIFSKDFFQNREILFHRNCYNELELLTYEVHNSGLSISFYDFRLEPVHEIQWHFTGNSINPLFLYLCPSNTSEAVLLLQEISSSFSFVEQPFIKYTHFIQWPEFSYEQLEDDVLSILQKENVQQLIRTFPMNADIYIAANYEKQYWKLTNTSKSILIELYSVHRNVSVAQVIWDSSNKVTHEFITRKISRRWNFQMAPIKGVVFKDIDGFNPETSFVQPTLIFEAISRAFNFSFIEVNGTGWIAPRKPSDAETDPFPLLYMGSQIMSGEADITVQCSEILSYRLRQLHMGPQLLPTRVIIMFRQPPASLLRNIYVKAFDWEVWGVYLAIWALLCASVFMALFIRRKRKEMFQSNKIKMICKEISQETFLWFMGSVTMQGINVSTATFTLKILRFSALILVIVCYTLYASSLYSILSNQKGPIQNYKDLIYSDITVVADHRALRGTEILTEIYLKRGFSSSEADKNVVDNMIAANKLISSSVAVISERDLWAQNINIDSRQLANKICQEHHRLEISVHGGAFVLWENGMRYRNENFRGAEGVYNCLPTKKIPSLGNNDVFSVYIVLGIGTVASLLFLFLEKSVAYSNSSSSKLRKS